MGPISRMYVKLILLRFKNKVKLSNREQNNKEDAGPRFRISEMKSWLRQSPLTLSKPFNLSNLSLRGKKKVYLLVNADLISKIRAFYFLLLFLSRNHVVMLHSGHTKTRVVFEGIQ